MHCIFTVLSFSLFPLGIVFLIILMISVTGVTYSCGESSTLGVSSKLMMEVHMENKLNFFLNNDNNTALSLSLSLPIE